MNYWLAFAYREHFSDIVPWEEWVFMDWYVTDEDLRQEFASYGT